MLYRAKLRARSKHVPLFLPSANQENGCQVNEVSNLQAVNLLKALLF